MAGQAGGAREIVPEAQHTQTIELSPGKSEYPARVLERPARVHGGRADGRKLRHLSN